MFAYMQLLNKSVNLQKVLNHRRCNLVLNVGQLPAPLPLKT